MLLLNINPLCKSFPQNTVVMQSQVKSHCNTLKSVAIKHLRRAFMSLYALLKEDPSICMSHLEVLLDCSQRLRCYFCFTSDEKGHLCDRWASLTFRGHLEWWSLSPGPTDAQCNIWIPVCVGRTNLTLGAFMLFSSLLTIYGQRLEEQSFSLRSSSTSRLQSLICNFSFRLTFSPQSIVLQANSPSVHQMQHYAPAPQFLNKTLWCQIDTLVNSSSWIWYCLATAGNPLLVAFSGWGVVGREDSLDGREANGRCWVVVIIIVMLLSVWVCLQAVEQN